MSPTSSTTPRRRLSFGEAAAHYTWKDLWRDERLPGAPALSIHCILPGHDDTHRSGSVYGLRYHCHGKCDFDGDKFDVIAKLHGCSNADAKRIVDDRLGGVLVSPPAATPRVAPAAPQRKPRRPPPLPPAVVRAFDEGIGWGELDTMLARSVDQMRGYPEGTAFTLLGMRALSFPRLHDDQRAIAFPLQFPNRHGCRFVGYHARLPRPLSGGRHPWIYVPKGSIALPYLLGSLHTADLVIVCEGEWDAAAFAAAAGWLRDPAVWPPRIAVLGMRGATSWRTMFDVWRRFWPRHVSALLLPDNDDAGRAWHTGEAGFARALATISRRVIALPLAAGFDGKDTNDWVRIVRPGPLDIRRLLVHAKLTDLEGHIL